MSRFNFRAWCPAWKIMLNLSGYKTISDNRIELYLKQGETLKVDLDKIILMQSTSIIDKNGNEIYEGDIIKGYDGCYYYLNCPVKYDNTKGAFILIEQTELAACYCGFETMTHLEVVGNIYENKELIENELV